MGSMSLMSSTNYRFGEFDKLKGELDVLKKL